MKVKVVVDEINWLDFLQVTWKKKKKLIEEIEIFSRKLEREKGIQESVGFSL